MDTDNDNKLFNIILIGLVVSIAVVIVIAFISDETTINLIIALVLGIVSVIVTLTDKLNPLHGVGGGGDDHKTNGGSDKPSGGSDKPSSGDISGCTLFKNCKSCPDGKYCDECDAGYTGGQQGKDCSAVDHTGSGGDDSGGSGDDSGGGGDDSGGGGDDSGGGGDDSGGGGDDSGGGGDDSGGGGDSCTPSVANCKTCVGAGTQAADPHYCAECDTGYQVDPTDSRKCI